jgi:hypothetical protein
MSVAWTSIRIPVELRDELEALSRELMDGYQEGRQGLPGRHAESVPWYHVIERALADYKAHRERGRRSKKTVKARPVDATAGGGVCIINEQENVNV